jgi:hypothetical protein
MGRQSIVYSRLSHEFHRLNARGSEGKVLHGITTKNSGAITLTPLSGRV